MATERALLSAIVESSDDAIVSKTLDGTIVSWNPAAERLFGFAAAEAIGKPMTIIIPSGRLDEERILLARVTRGETIARYETVRVRKDHLTVDVSVTLSPILDEHGRIVGASKIAHDITERKRDEAALIAAQREAERANDAKSRLLAAASHDLRQPVQALNLQIGILGKRFNLGDAPLLKDIRNSLFSLNELLGDLLDLSKLDAGAITPNIGAFPVFEMLASVLAIHSTGAEAKNLRLRVVASRLTACTDRVLLERILGNLLANAVRYTDWGGIVIGCRRRQGKVWVEVYDTGIGISQDKTVEIFEEFKQLGNLGRCREKGSGLGLAIVKRTADLLGLAIRVSSRPGRGSCFAIELPVGKAADVASPPSRDARAICRKLRVAVVEDDVALLQTLIFALEDIGHEVVGATTTKAIVACLGKVAPDVLVADYRLSGGETGIDAVTSVQAAFGTRIPALILTGDTTPDKVREIVSHGVLVRHKPLKLDVLTECLREMAEAGHDGVVAV